MVERLRQERSDLVRLAALVPLGFPPRPARPLREDWLHLRGRPWRLAELPDAEALSAEELAAGRPPDGAVVAPLRRPALSIRPHHSALVPRAAGLTVPLCHPG
ncbi:hypothetical protein VM98_38020, partial [Streptomyces rubellomurinus subsp. indigoferus]